MNYPMLDETFIVCGSQKYPIDNKVEKYDFDIMKLLYCVQCSLKLRNVLCFMLHWVLKYDDGKTNSYSSMCQHDNLS